MSVTHLIASAMSATLALLGSAAPAAAHVVVQSTGSGVGAFTPGRSWSVVAVLLGLTGAIVGGLALARSPGPGTRSGRGSVVALVTGLAGAGGGGAVVAAAARGPRPRPPGGGGRP